MQTQDGLMATPTLFTPMVPHAGCHPLSNREREVLKEYGRTFELLSEPGGGVIRCLVCLRVSYYPDDRNYLFCGACNAFHDERARLWEVELERITEDEQAAIPTSEEKP